jgi:hypothetical protein
MGPPSCITNQSKSLAKTRSPSIPNSLRMALSRLLVVLDCQPPSKSWMKFSPTLAIRLPWRRTSDSPASLSVTVVLAEVQLSLALMAAFIWVSILRMWFEVVCLVCGQYRAPRGQSRSEMFQLPYWPSGAGSIPWRIRSRRAVSRRSSSR